MSAGNMGKPQTHLTATYIKVLISEQPYVSHIMIKSSEVKVLNKQIPCAAHLLSNISYSKHQNAVRTKKKKGQQGIAECVTMHNGEAKHRQW